MDCHRCHGFMVTEHLVDVFDGPSPTHAAVWRCLNCGELYDTLVLSHRMYQRTHPSVQNHTD